MSRTYREFGDLLSAYNEANEKWMPIQKAYELLDSVNENGIWEQRHAAADALFKYIAELEAAQRWHVVADGELPEVGEEVFVCDESGHRRVDWLVCKPIDGVGETLFYSAAYDDDPPTHWMPLPKLPEVQE